MRRRAGVRQGRPQMQHVWPLPPRRVKQLPRPVSWQRGLLQDSGGKCASHPRFATRLARRAGSSTWTLPRAGAPPLWFVGGAKPTDLAVVATGEAKGLEILVGRLRALHEREESPLGLLGSAVEDSEAVRKASSMGARQARVQRATDVALFVALACGDPIAFLRSRSSGRRTAA